MKIKDENYSVGKGHGSYVEHNKGESTHYKRGSYYSLKGIVDVYAENDSIHGIFINMSFVYNGTLYSRCIYKSKSISDKALSTRANQFVKSLNL